MTPRGGTVRGLVVLGGGTALAALLGLGFQSLMAYWFGAGAVTDAFFMSTSIFLFLGKFLMLTQLKSLALPPYARLRAADEDRARQFAGALIGFTCAAVAVLSVILVLASPLLVDALAPGYEGSMRELTIRLLQIRIPGLPFLAGTTVGMALLESERRFGVSISAQKVVPAALSLALLLVVADRAGIMALGWISLITSVAGALVIWLPVRSWIGSLALGPATRDPELRRVGKRWVGLGSSNAASFAGEWAFRIGASLLPVGLFSAVLYGRMVHDPLHAAINDTAQTVALPRFSAAIGSDSAGATVAADESAASVGADAHARLGPVLRETLGGLATISMPLAVMAAATAPWSVALLFGRGKFLADGMLGPAAISLALFLIGFVLQGLVQILFAAAFATHRSDLVNRVQMLGHLVRTVAIVPLVMTFSYVGLPVAQAGMNALVLALLVWWAPREWGLTGRVGPVVRHVVAAAVPTALYLILVAPRLPDPLSVGTLARFGILASIGIVWTLIHGALALALALPGTDALRRRLGRATPAALTVLALTFGVGAATPGRAAAQSGAGWSAAPEGHWGLAVLEWLEARGALGAGTSTTRPLPAAAVATLLGRATAEPLAMGATARFAEERGERGALASWIRLAPTLGLDERSGALAVNLGTESSVPFAFLDVEQVEQGRIVRGGVGFRVGGFWAAAGRERVRLGGGVTGAIVLNPSAYLDGLSVGTATPLDAGFLGAVSILGGLGPLPRYEAVHGPWWGHLRVTARPSPWIQIGLSRAAMVGGRFDGGTVAFDPLPYGPDEGSFSLADIPGLLIGRSEQFDNQVAAVDVRISTASIGVPALAYGEMGWEDSDRSWGDPGLVAGILLALAAPIPAAVRYEYAAFGADARLCGWCDTLPAFWYQHTRFQSGWQAGGELLGHPLGGYGRQHAVEAGGWSPDGRIRANVRVSWLRRDPWNLRSPGRSGRATRVEGGLAGRIGSRLELSGGWAEESGGGWRDRAWRLLVTGLL